MENFSINSELTDAQFILVMQCTGRYVHSSTHEYYIHFLDVQADSVVRLDKRLSLSQVINYMVSEKERQAILIGTEQAKSEIRYALGIE